MTLLERCECYVRELAPSEAFELRLGAHALDCPAYRTSLDTFDREADAMYRERLQFGPGANHG